MKTAERAIEQFLFRSRWLMVPFYLGLVLSLAVLMVKFVQELLHLAPRVLDLAEAEVILGVLSLIDLSLAGNLILMVTFAGYESFVSRIETDDDVNRPDWMGKVDFSGMKLKLVASIVAISAIHLLKAFMNVSQVSDSDFKWMVITHITFVGSGVLLAAMDWLHMRVQRAGGDH